MKDYYYILDISITASSDDIKKAYRINAIKYHPDKHFNDKYFTEKFIEVQKAYEILSDVQKRKEYDIEYKIYFAKEEDNRKANFKVEKQKEKEREEQFFYDPYKPFYSYQDRIVQDTPQFNPRINHWGEPLPDSADFFVLPKRIGKLISGYTTLDKNTQLPSGFFGKMFGSFKHTCTFMGINGFAEYRCEGDRKNIIKTFEFNFNEVTDFASSLEIRKLNFSYANTHFDFIWLNKGEKILEINDTHYNKENNPERSHTNFWTSTWAETYWTLYLLDNMEKVLSEKGSLEFGLVYFLDGRFQKFPWIQLGIGFITFVSVKGNTTYNFDEIKRVYIKDTHLFIEHNNYEKKFLLFESGNKNGIPLMNLSNRKFFFKAMEIMLGYKFS